MKCRKCGAELLDTDAFCIKCGQKANQPMFCSSCGEQLREGERFCHKCGSPVESAGEPAEEDEEIPLTSQRTVDIPFAQIEQGILLEAEQAIVKRPKSEETERKDTEGYGRPGAEEPERQKAPAKDEDDGDGDGEEDGEDDEDAEDSKMKLIALVLGVVVAAIALAAGFVWWQQHPLIGKEKPGGVAGQKVSGGEEDEETGESGKGEDASKKTIGRIQILSGVNIRNKPTTKDSEVLMVAKKGETYEYYELVDNAWYHIQLEDGKEGYVSAKYVEDLK